MPVNVNFIIAHTPAIVSSIAGISTDYQNPNLQASGTLIYAVNPEDGKTYVLLSKERIWEGPNSGKWKGFGGKKEPQESLIETALRETKEESRGLIEYSKNQIPFDQLIAVEHYHCKYLQFMLPVEYDPAINDRFQDSLFDNQYFMEKTEVRWIPLENLVATIREADVISKQNECTPFDVEASIHIDGEELYLGHDFTETMTILLRESPETLDRLMDHMPHSRVLVSDKNWETTKV